MITPPLEEDFVFFALETEEKKERREIPVRVMLNHFSAIRNHIYDCNDRFDLNKLLFFKNKLQRIPTADKKKVRQLLFNSWNTEKLLRKNAESDDENYLRTALHWSFVQLYYSAYLNMYAFYLAKSITCKTHEAILKQFASLVKSNSYPVCISFFADGEMKNFDYTHLTLAQGEKIQHFDQFQNGFHNDNQIALFLKTTREKKAILLKEERQSHSKSAIQNPAGKVLSKFKPEHWKQITDKMGVTTLFDMLYRQRIKANYQDIENLMYARQDAVEFHGVISEILYYLNFVHEAYLCKIVGLKEIESMTKDFSDNFEGNHFVAERFTTHIKPLF